MSHRTGLQFVKMSCGLLLLLILSVGCIPITDPTHNPTTTITIKTSLSATPKSVIQTPTPTLLAVTFPSTLSPVTVTPSASPNITPYPIPTKTYTPLVIAGEIAFTTFNKDRDEIFMMQLEDRASRCLTCDQDTITVTYHGNLDWSPDGTQIVFSAYQATYNYESQIYTLHVETRQVKRLTDDLLGADSPHWSPDGGQIVYVSGDLDEAEICVLTLSDETSQCLTQNAEHDGSPIWSPDGTRIVFVSNHETEDISGEIHERLYSMTADGIDIQLLAEIVGRIGYPAWSPDGRYLAFVFAPPKGGSAGKIHILDMETKHIRRLTTSETDLAEISPSWSPDGQYIVFSHEAARTSQIVLVRADGSQWTEVTPLGVPNDSKAPDWRITK